MRILKAPLPVLALGALLAPSPAPAQPPGHITGIGGVFVTSKDPQALAAWYRDVLGIKLEKWGGALFPAATPGHPPESLWNAMPTNSDEIVPSKRDFMINFAVDNLDAYLKRLRAKKIPILSRQDDPHEGDFAWIIDPDGTKIELWQPPAK